MTSPAWKPKVELLVCGTEATTEGVRTTGKPELRRSPVVLKGWRVKVQPETRKSAAEAEQRLTEADPDGPGNLEESQGWGTTGE